MNKLLFVTIVGVLGVASCKAGEEAQPLPNNCSHGQDDYGQCLYWCQICGQKICSRAQARFFIGPRGSYVHAACREFINHVAIPYYYRCCDTFSNGSGAHSADIINGVVCDLVRHIQEQVAPLTILAYAQQQNGLEKLKLLFDRNSQSAISLGLTLRGRFAAEEARERRETSIPQLFPHKDIGRYVIEKAEF